MSTPRGVTVRCYDCLRDYSNADLHAVLDWRLAMDLCELAADVGADISLDNGRWADLVDRAKKTLGEVVPGQIFLMAHPLHRGIEPGPDSCNVFDAIRRPGLVAAVSRQLSPSKGRISQAVADSGLIRDIAFSP